MELIGVEHVGCGFDFCEFLPSEASEPPAIRLADSSQVPYFLECLRRLGMSEAEIKAVARDNFLRVLEKILG